MEKFNPISPVVFTLPTKLIKKHTYSTFSYTNVMMKFPCLNFGRVYIFDVPAITLAENESYQNFFVFVGTLTETPLLLLIA